MPEVTRTWTLPRVLIDISMIFTRPWLRDREYYTELLGARRRQHSQPVTLDVDGRGEVAPALSSGSPRSLGPSHSVRNMTGDFIVDVSDTGRQLLKLGTAARKSRQTSSRGRFQPGAPQWHSGVAALTYVNAREGGAASYADCGDLQKDEQMKLRLIGAAFAISLLPVTASAQVSINMAEVTCGQYLAMAPSTSRDFSAWMSGWFSYQTRRTFVDVLAHQKNMDLVKAWCATRPDTSVMSALHFAIDPQ